ncbi:MAG: TIGR00730 family Rossman fold protein [Sporichthyaceae bacterium]
MASIAVFCASAEAIAQEHRDLAAAVGAELAARGHVLVSGGGSVSSMGALARAARAGGGHTIGVIPQALVSHEVADHDADELLVTPDMRSRKGEMDSRADAFLVLPGGIGTLEELFEIWVARSLRMHDRPVVVLDPTGVYAPLRAQIDLLVEQGFVRPEAVDVLVWTTTVSAAFEALEAPTTTAEAAVEEALEAEL